MSGRTLEDLAAAHGIEGTPRRGFGPCPVCNATQRSATDRRGPLNIARGRGGRDAWKCHAQGCGAGGGAHKLLEALGAPRRERLDLVQRPRMAARIDVSAGWNDFAAVAGHWRELVEQWARDVRGWGPSLARAVARLPDVAWSDLPKAAPLDAKGRALAKAAGRTHPLMVAQWAGETRWSAERRWVLPVLPPGHKKALALGREHVGERSEDLPRTFGSPGAAARALMAGETVALVEGSPDYLAAAGAGLVALGAASAGELKGIGEYLAGLMPLGAPGRLVCIAHAGDRADVGAVSMRAAIEALRGVVRVAWADLSAVLPAGKGDLADAVRLAVAAGAEGAAAVRQIIDGAALVEPAPAPAVSLDDAEAAIVAAIDPLPSPDTVRLVAVPYGAGKTRAAARMAPHVAARDVAVAYVTPTHDLAAEVTREALASLGDLGVEVVHMRGLMALDDEGEPVCRARRDAIGDAREQLDAALASSGRRVCGDCPHRETCPLAPPPALKPGRVAVMPLALFRALDVPAGAVAFLDDCGATVETVERTPADVKALADAHGIAESEALAAKALAGLASGLAVDVPEDAREVAICGGDLVAHLRELPAVRHLAAEAQLYARHPEDLSPPEPAARLRPSAGTLGGVSVESRGRAAERDARAVVLMAAALAGGVPPHNGAALELVAAADGGRAWRIVRPPPPMPAGVVVVALDGGAHRRPETWRRAAEASGRTLDQRTVRVTPPREVPAFHRDCRALDRGRILHTQADGRRVWHPSAPGALRAALADLAFRLRAENVAAGARVAVLTHKPLAAALAGDDAHGAATAAELRAVWAGWCTALDVVPVVDALPDEDDPTEAATPAALGHYGRHDRGHNAWRGVAAVALLGTPRPPPALMASISRAYLPAGTAAEVDDLAGDLGREACAETLAQGLARGRHLREPGLRFLYLSASAGVSDGPDLPGLVWTRYDGGPGDRTPDSDPAAASLRADERAAAEAHATAHGAIAGVVLAAEAGIDRRHAAARAAEVGRARGWIAHVVGRHNVWAPAGCGDKSRKYLERNVFTPVLHASARACVVLGDCGEDVENQGLAQFASTDPPPDAAAAEALDPPDLAFAPVVAWAGLPCPPREVAPVRLPELREAAARVVAAAPGLSADSLAAEVAFRTGRGSRLAARLAREALDVDRTIDALRSPPSDTELIGLACSALDRMPAFIDVGIARVGALAVAMREAWADVDVQRLAAHGVPCDEVDDAELRAFKAMGALELALAEYRAVVDAAVRAEDRVTAASLTEPDSSARSEALAALADATALALGLACVLAHD